MKIQIAKNLLWRKAAILGSIWAASEIILGSFLHNIRLPFKGEIMTAIGIAVMAAGLRVWPEKGLLWRSGLICAAMKSISPSAALAGPMIAISMEGFLADFGTRFFGRGAAGMLIGGGLAMMWAIIHKIINLLIFYGADAAVVYIKTLEWLKKTPIYNDFTNIIFSSVWTPLLLTLSIYFVLGATAALFGRYSAHNVSYQQIKQGISLTKGFIPSPKSEIKTSISLLIFHIILVMLIFSLGKRIPGFALYAVTAAYTAFCAFYYPRAKILFMRYGVWISIIAASLIIGLVLGNIKEGIYLACRAILMTFAFSALSSELVNPKIRNIMEKIFGSIFFETLEYSFGTLPGVITFFPKAKQIILNPSSSLNTIISAAPYMFENGRAKVIIISGNQGEGKTTLVKQTIQALKDKGIKPAGIYADGLIDDNKRSGFDAVNIISDERTPLCRKDLKEYFVKAGPFCFYKSGINFGLKALSAENIKDAKAVFLDEIGFLELQGKCWGNIISTLTQREIVFITTVRNSLVDDVIEYWDIKNADIYDVNLTTADNLSDKIIEYIKKADLKN